MKRSTIGGIGSMAVGAGIAASAVLGPLVLGLIRFRTSASLERQFIGGEVVSLVAVAPIAIVAGGLWLRGHRLGPPLALGPALYCVYTYVTAILGQEYTRYDGNVERYFPLYTALVAGGAMLSVRAWSELGRQPVPELSPPLRRTLAGIFLGVGSLFALAWAGQIWRVYEGPPSTEYLEGPTLFWLIKLLDLGFVIPALVATGSGLIRRRGWAIQAACGLAPFVTCLAGSIASMGVVMQIAGDASAEPAMLIVLVPLTVALGYVTGLLLRSYGRVAPSAGLENKPDHFVTQLSYPLHG